MMLKLHYLIATGFGVGKIPFMPGTMGSVLGMSVFHLNPIKSITLNMAILVVLIVVGAFSSLIIERTTEQEDNQIIVIDEIAGVWLTLLFIPKGIWWPFVGLILFRLFDIWKPFPIRKLEKVKYGYGVMLDDLLAGLYAGFSILLISQII